MPTLAPRYYPLHSFKPEIRDISGKVAVITGASRGLGRAVGEALTELGVVVVGTSRNPPGVPNPPPFPLLPLDIASPASVRAFPAILGTIGHAKVDILVNNAGRYVAGEIIPQPSSNLEFYLSQRDLALRTVYFGHVMLTNLLLPLMPKEQYARIIFTVSIASYSTGAGLPGGSGLDAYNSAKAALRGYANALGAASLEKGWSIRVSTVNPYFMNTALVTHPNPIYTQPVNSSGLSDTDKNFNDLIMFLRQTLRQGLPPGLVGRSYAQLLRMNEPEQNVVVGSPLEPLATRGGNAIIESTLVAENRISAIPWETR
jgi:NAD(P)-dependent dehydrogenase (short-subunit alcohol dehydrogenase family)